RISRPSVPTSRPSSFAEPELIGKSCSKHFMNVLLPAPLGPRSPIAPRATCRLTPSSARCGPKTLVRFCVSMTKEDTMFYVGIGHYLGLLVTTSFQIREIGLESAPIK